GRAVPFAPRRWSSRVTLKRVTDDGPRTPRVVGNATTDLNALTAACLDDPDDEGRLAVLSDWLEERGDARADAVRRVVRWRDSFVGAWSFGPGGRMSEEDGFLTSIQATPADNTPRLVYADWLEERGGPRGEVLRVECLPVAPPAGEQPDPQPRARYVALWLSSDPEWLGAVDRLSARVLPTGAWEEYRRAPSHWRPGLKADLLCHLLLGLYGPPRSAQSLSAADLGVAFAEKRVLEVAATRDDFGTGSAGVFRATPEPRYGWGSGTAIPGRYGHCPFLPR